jgi:hypothetical protein
MNPIAIQDALNALIFIVAAVAKHSNCDKDKLEDEIKIATQQGGRFSDGGVGASVIQAFLSTTGGGASRPVVLN